MNKLIMFMALITYQPWGLVWGASYLIHLQNGNELRTSHYWEEGDEIKFYIYGGIAGIHKAFVARVTISDVNYKNYNEDVLKGQIPIVVSGPKSTVDPKSEISGKEGGSNEKIEKDEPIDFEYYRERKAAIKEKLDDALQRSREATARKDQDAKDLTRQEYLEYSRQIINLGDELKRKNKGVMPDWWEE